MAAEIVLTFYGLGHLQIVASMRPRRMAAEIAQHEAHDSRYLDRLQ